VADLSIPVRAANSALQLIYDHWKMQKPNKVAKALNSVRYHVLLVFFTNLRRSRSRPPVAHVLPAQRCRRPASLYPSNASPSSLDLFVTYPTPTLSLR
jgi:hypothetical protein